MKAGALAAAVLTLWAALAAAIEPQKKVVGGAPAPIASYGFYAYIQVSTPGKAGVEVCGGSVIAPQTVVTAAHCFSAGSTGTVYLNLKNKTSAGQVRPEWGSMEIGEALPIEQAP